MTTTRHITHRVFQSLFCQGAILAILLYSFIPRVAEYGSHHLNLSESNNEMALLQGEDGVRQFHQAPHVPTVYLKRDLSLIVPARYGAHLFHCFFSTYERN